MGQVIRLSLVGCLAAWLAIGCEQVPVQTQGTGDGQVLGTPPLPGKLSGQLIVDPTASGFPVLEAEPNDTIDYVQTVGQALPDLPYVIQGEIGNRLTTDSRDSFRFVTQQPLEVTLTLEFGSGLQLKAAVMNFRDFLCTPKAGMPSDFSHCSVSTSATSEGIIFVVDDVFDVVVVPVSDFDLGEYLLTLEFAPAIGGSSLMKAGSGEGGGDDGGDDDDEPESPGNPGNINPDPAPHRNPRVAYTPAAEHVKLGQLLVSRRLDGTSMGDLTASLAAAGFTVLRSSPSGWCLVDAGVDPRESKEQQWRETLRAAARAQGIAGVARSTLNYLRFPQLEPPWYVDQYDRQWHLRTIHCEEAWDVTTGDSSVVVGILDSGIIDHPDLYANLGSEGYDFFDHDTDPTDPVEFEPTEEINECFSHGSYCAGIIGANGYSIGVNWEVTLMPLRVGGAYYAGTFAWTEALRYAAQLPNSSGRIPTEPARVANLSFGGSYPDPIAEEAVAEAQSKGLLVVAAAGNEDSGDPLYPASFSGVVNVAGVGPVLTRKASYSNYGPTITLTAPGGEIANGAGGTWSTSRFLPTGYPDCVVGWESSQGTSFACPHVVGVAALMLAANPTLTADQLRSILINTAEDLGEPGPDDIFGAGLLNASGAVRMAAQMAGAAPVYPALELDPAQLDLGQVTAEATVDVSNAGTGVLQIQAVETMQRYGATKWLNAYTVSGGVNTNVDSIVVKVNRQGLARGRYLGNVVVREQNRGQSLIPVVMDVGEDMLDVAGGEIFVLAVDAGSNTTVAWTTTTPTMDYYYRFESLPPGQYYIYAGTDGDGDGQICEFGEVCGVYGGFASPQTVTVFEDQETLGQNFVLGYAPLD